MTDPADHTDHDGADKRIEQPSPDNTILYVGEETPHEDPSPQPVAPTIVPLVPGYEVLEELGRGGMGVVYKARQIRANRIVALKMVLTGSQATALDLARFRAEAQSLGRLQHPGIVQVYEVGDWHPEGSSTALPYFSLEYCPEGSLVRKLDGTPRPPREAAALAEQLAQAIAVAHAAGIIHRDLKPANILLRRKTSVPDVQHPANPDQAATPVPFSEFEFRISDFGLAKQTDDTSGQTHTGSIMGTPSYMAPEQAEGKVREIGPAADIYALGAMLYECLTGRPPFRAASVLETVRQVLDNDPVPVRQLQPGVPRDLETICLKCLHKDPAKRYATAGDLASDLHRFLNEEPIVARPVGSLERAWKWANRRPAVAGLLVALVLVGLTGITGISWQYGLAVRERDNARTAEAAARQERDNALEQQRLASLAEERSRERAELARRTLADSRIALAEAAWRDGQTPLAFARLDDIPFDLRRWEWFYLDRLFSGGLFRLPARSFWQHEIAYSPDGQQLASVSDAGIVHVWDSGTGAQVRSASVGNSRGFLGSLNSLVWTPDGQSLAVGGQDGIIRLLDVATLTEQRTHSVGAPGIETLAISPDGQLIASGGVDGKIRLWNLAGNRSAELAFLGGKITCVRFSSVGSRLVAISTTGQVRVLDLRTGRELLALSGLTGRHVVFSPDGRALAGYSRGAIRVWDSSTGKEIAEVSTMEKPPTCLSYSPDGLRLAVASDDAVITLWELGQAAGGVQPRQPLARLRGHQPRVMGLSFSPDGQRLASCGYDRWALVWDILPETARQALLPRLAGVRHLVPSHDGRYLACAGQGFAVTVLNGQADQVVVRLDRQIGQVNGLAFHPERPLLAITAATRKSVLLWDVESNREEGRLTTARALVGAVSFSPDGRWVAAGAQRGALVVWDLATSAARILEDEGQQITQTAFSRNGNWLATGNADGQVRVWDLVAGKLLHRLEGHASGVLQVAYSPDSQLLASSGADGSVRLWDALSGAPQGILEGHSGSVFGLQFSSDGQRLVSGGDQTVRIWDTQSGTELLTLSSPVGQVYAVTFSPDGHRLLCSGQNGLWSWQALPTRPRLSLRGHTGPIRDTAFSPDGQVLASCSEDHTVRLWEAHTGTLRRVLRGHSAIVNAIAFSPDGKQLVSSAWGTKLGQAEVFLWDVDSGQRLHAFPGVRPGLRVGFNADGTEVEAVGPGGTGRRWAVVSGQILPGVPHAVAGPAHQSQTQLALIQGARIELVDLTPLPDEELVQRRAATSFDRRWHEVEQQRLRTQQQYFAEWYHLNQLLAYQPDLSQAGAARRRAVRKATETEPANTVAWAILARLHLEAEAPASYRVACAELAQRAQDSTNPDTIALATRVCGLAPRALPDLQPMLDLALRQAEVRTAETLTTVGALLLRLGRSKEAIAILVRAERQRVGPPIRESLLLALAHVKLGQRDQARKRLQRACDLLDQPQERLRCGRVLSLLPANPLGAAVQLSVPLPLTPRQPNSFDDLDEAILRREAEEAVREMFE